MKKIFPYIVANAALLTMLFPTLLYAAPNPVAHPCVVLSSSADVGSSDATTKGDVSKIQYFLAATGKIKKTDVTGYFGPTTQAAIKQLQAQHGLAQVGTVGPQTRALMSRDCAPAPQSGSTFLIGSSVGGIVNPQVSFVDKIVQFLNPSSLLGDVADSVEGITGASYTQSVTSFTLVDDDTNQDIGTVLNGATIDLSRLPTTNLDIRANTTPSTVVNDVRFSYGTNSIYSTDKTAPYTIRAGTNNGWALRVGAHTIKATPYNKNKQSGNSLSVSFTVINSGATSTDTVAPTVSFASPSGNQTVSGNTAINITATASDNVGVSRVEFYKNGVLFATDTTSPYGTTWTSPAATTTAQANTFQAKAYDAAGNVGVSSQIALTVAAVTAPPSDTTPPTTSITSPATGQTVSGSVTIAASATDNVGVTKVELYKNSALFGTNATSPYSFTWTTPAQTTSAQSFNFMTKAYDAAGNVGSSGSVVLNIAALPPGAPVLTFAANPVTVVKGNSSALTWSSTNATTCTASGAWTGALALSGTQSVSPTASSTYVLSCTGAGGTSSSSAAVAVTLPTDTVPPTVSLTSPTNGQILSGTVTANVTASDNVGVASIGLKLDGGTLGSTMPTSPATFSIDTTKLANGTHMLSAFATDAAGNTGTTTAISITINNAVAPPNPVAVQVRNMVTFNELYVDGTPGNDTINIGQSGNNIVVTANGTTQSFTGPFGDVVLKGEAGNNILSVDNTVTDPVLVYGGPGSNTLTAAGGAKVTMITIGDSGSTITGNGNTMYWVGTNDTTHPTSAETSAGKVHVISAFYQPWTTNKSDPNYISLNINAGTSTMLKEPTDTSGDTVYVLGHSLWGAGPVADDINQGYYDDCYYLAAADGLAFNNPSAFQNLAVDLGDGTYAVQFDRNGTKTYVRVDADLDYTGAHPGATSDLWGMVFEKAYAYFREAANTYASIDYGNSGTALGDFGYNSLSDYPTGQAVSTVYNLITKEVTSNKASVANTPSSGTTLITGHSYTIIGATTDSSGNQSIVLRNPWGFSAPGTVDPSDSSIGSISVSTFNANVEWFDYVQ